MKNYLILSLLLITFISSCKEDDNAPPRATANFDFTNCEAPCTVTFVNISQNATSYYWNFGDGTNSTEVNPKHLYENEGTYTVSLEAKGEGGNHTRTKDVVIAPPVFQMKYKVNGVTNEATSLQAYRDTPAGNMSLTTTANGSPPLFNFIVPTPSAGFVNNSTFNFYAGSPGMAYHVDINNTNYSSLNDSSGINLIIDYINYVNGGIVTGTFSGTVKSSGGVTKQITEGNFKMQFTN